MKKLLIVVDMLNDFCHRDGVLATSPITSQLYAEEIIKEVTLRVEEARSHGTSIIWLCDAHAKDDKEFDRFPAHAIKDTWGAAIIDELKPVIAEHSSVELIIGKTRYSGFYSTELEYQLMRMAPDEITVVGVCTSICVMDTVGGLANRDQNVIVPANCVADFDPQGNANALQRMERLYGAKIV
jgi:nicotinamidase-related amidase